MHRSQKPAIPFFSTTTPAQERRRLLLISYHFPPATAVGALRWEKLASLFAEFGWRVDVITLDPSQLASVDHSRLSQLPPGMRLFGVPMRRLLHQRAQKALTPLMRAVQRARSAAVRRGPPSAVDATVPRSTTEASSSLSRDEILASARLTPAVFSKSYHAWSYYAVYGQWAADVSEIGCDLARSTRFDLVITSGPPHMAHIAGQRVAKTAQVPLVVDLRDPWSLVERMPEWMGSPTWYTLSARYERRVLRDARLIVLNTEASRSALASIYPEHASRMITILNGADVDPIPSVTRAPYFLVAFAGSIYLDRNPRPLFRAASVLVRELALTPQQFRIALIGNLESYGGVPVSEIAEQEGIAEYVEVGPPRSRAAAREFLARASLLVSLPQDSEMAIPAKIFEYTQFEAWLLIFARPGSATELLLRGTAADVVDPEDCAAVTTVLRRRYLEHAAGQRPTAIGADGRFDRRRQADILRQAIERVVAA